MFSKLCKLVTLSLVAGIALATKEENKQAVATLFDNDSEFMRGFETGLFLRSKGGNVEEYGCSMPSVEDSRLKMAFDMIRTNIDLATSAITLDPYIEQGLNTIMDFFDGLHEFTTILQPKGFKGLDQYCTGMVFGLQGSRLLVQVANTLINPLSKDGNVKKVLPKKSTFGKLAEGVMRTV